MISIQASRGSRKHVQCTLLSERLIPGIALRVLATDMALHHDPASFPNLTPTPR